MLGFGVFALLGAGFGGWILAWVGGCGGGVCGDFSLDGVAGGAILWGQSPMLASIFSCQEVIMSYIHFLPWVGDNYRNCTGLFGKRVFVLAESHYQWSENTPLKTYPKLTIECIDGHCGGGASRFWTRIVNVIQGKMGWRSNEERTEFWSSVAFANFVQESAGFGPRNRPTVEMWEHGRLAFPELLDDLRPNLIIVLGKELWGNLPQNAINS